MGNRFDGEMRIRAEKMCGNSCTLRQWSAVSDQLAARGEVFRHPSGVRRIWGVALRGFALAAPAAPFRQFFGLERGEDFGFDRRRVVVAVPGGR